MPNNRQLATLILLTALGIWIMTRSDLRSSVRKLLRDLGHPKLLIPTSLFVGYIGATVFCGRQLSVWTTSLVTDTVFWFAGSGFVLYLNVQDLSRKEHYIRRTILRTLSITVAVEFLVNLFVLPLWAELLVQPILAALVMTSAVAGAKDEFRSAKRLIDGLIALAGLALGAAALVRLGEKASTLPRGEDVRRFALPIWLTIATIPFIYVVSLISNYELVLMRLQSQQSSLRGSAEPERVPRS